MARGENTAGHPGRKVGADRFKSPGGNFGQGPALEKNESGRGYHVKGAPGFQTDRYSAAADFYEKTTRGKR
jgi:hypothetical protein